MVQNICEYYGRNSAKNSLTLKFTSSLAYLVANTDIWARSSSFRGLSYSMGCPGEGEGGDGGDGGGEMNSNYGGIDIYGTISFIIRRPISLTNSTSCLFRTALQRLTLLF